MRTAFVFTVDLAAISVLTFGVYFRRHRRRDMVLAYVALNVGVMLVTHALLHSTAGAGLGLGLFGVLSIIRLRSSSLTQEEVAYYFVALALGLVAGIDPGRVWLLPSLATALVTIVALVDHPRLLARYRQQRVTLDAAITDDTELVHRLEELLDADVCHHVVDEVDLVRDVTVVDVRYRLRQPVTMPAVLPPPPPPLAHTTDPGALAQLERMVGSR